MAVYVALLRAIGAGTHAIMSMTPLREACEQAGLADVITVGSTGNVIFRSDASSAHVRKLVQEVVNSFGLDSEVFITTPRKMAAVLAANPFPKAAAERPGEVGVCTFHRAPDWSPVTEDYAGPEKRATIGAHLVVEYPDGVTTSRLRIEKRLGAKMTMRNWRVFAGLAEKAAALAKS